MSTSALVKVADIANSGELSSLADLNDGMQSNILCTSSITTMTPDCMAPEPLPCQVSVTLRPSKATDVYPFAILAYELVHQKQAWDSIHITMIESISL